LLIGKNAKLLTGTDEHGKKIEDTATKQKLAPKEFCDIMVKQFVDMNAYAGTSYDHFIRTTDSSHEELVKQCINKSVEKNDIYVGEYKGYYSVREESYVTNETAKLNNFVDPVTNVPYESISEESYFFTLPKYKNTINECITTIYPQKYSNEINERLCKLKDLEDLSISRTTFDWGIKFPQNDKHTVYVWQDALYNYVTGCKMIFGNENVDRIYHIIGKDITWFHSVIYPALLESSDNNDYFPTKILVHGFVNDSAGRKMSKSLGNVVSISDLNKYPLEAVRFYLLTESQLGDDINFSVDNLVKKFDNILIDAFGNVVLRLASLCNGLMDEINNTKINKTFSADKAHEYINNFDLTGYYNYTFSLIRDLNMYITSKKPWNKQIAMTEKLDILKNCLYDLNIITKLLYPYIPVKIMEIRNVFGFSHILDLNNNCIENLCLNYKSGQKFFNLISARPVRTKN